MTEQPSGTVPEEHPIEAAVRAGYAFEGAALELGALMLDASTTTAVPVRLPTVVRCRREVATVERGGYGVFA